MTLLHRDAGCVLAASVLGLAGFRVGTDQREPNATQDWEQRRHDDRRDRRDSLDDDGRDRDHRADDEHPR